MCGKILKKRQIHLYASYTNYNDREMVNEKYWAPIFGSQTFDQGGEGAHTGANTLDQIKTLVQNLQYLATVKERGGESDESVAARAKESLAKTFNHNLRRGEGEAWQRRIFGFYKNTIRKKLEGCRQAGAEKLIIAYEPLWAIRGTSSSERITNT